MARRDTHLIAVPVAFAVNGFALLEFDRKPIDRHPLRGFLIDQSVELSLVQVVESHTFQLNGYAVIRNEDVRRWRAIPNNDFSARAAVHHKLRPSKPNAVAISSMREAIASAGVAFPLITLHRERVKRDVCYVGRMLGTSQRAVKTLSISPQAEWEKHESYSLKDITLLEFGGAYEKLLMLMAKK